MSKSDESQVAVQFQTAPTTRISSALACFFATFAKSSALFAVTGFDFFSASQKTLTAKIAEKGPQGREGFDAITWDATAGV